MDNSLILTDVNKHYKKKHALKDFNYTFSNGIYGLLGPNGSGKSTLMNLIAGLIKADSGSKIEYNGNAIHRLGKEYRSIIGYMPQQQDVFRDFTAAQFLAYMAALKGIDNKMGQGQIKDLLSRVELTDVTNKRIGSFSGGMKQRLLLAGALLGEPKLLLLDEPTAGVDPRQRVEIKQLIKSIAKDKMIIISTHIVSDIESIADYIILLRQGEIARSAAAEVLLADTDLETLYMKYFGDGA